jgi:hypothetical protein
VHSQGRGLLASALAIARFQPLANPAMEPQAPPDRQPVVHHLLIQGMEEPIAPCNRPVCPCLHATPPQELAPSHQRLASLLDGIERFLNTRGHRRHRELHPYHTRGLQQPSFFGTESLELPLDHLPHVLRDVGL